MQTPTNALYILAIWNSSSNNYCKRSLITLIICLHVFICFYYLMIITRRWVCVYTSIIEVDMCLFMISHFVVVSYSFLVVVVTMATSGVLSHCVLSWPIWYMQLQNHVCLDSQHLCDRLATKAMHVWLHFMMKVTWVVVYIITSAQ